MTKLRPQTPYLSLIGMAKLRGRHVCIQWRLRTLLLCVLAINVILGVYAIRVREEADAAALIINGGGQCFYDYNMKTSLTGKIVFDKAALEERRDFFGVALPRRWTARIVAVTFDQVRPSTCALDAVRRLSSLKYLGFYHTGINDADLTHIKKVRGLEHLYLYSELNLSQDAIVDLQRRLGCDVSI